MIFINYFVVLNLSILKNSSCLFCLIKLKVSNPCEDVNRVSKGCKREIIIVSVNSVIAIVLGNNKFFGIRVTFIIIFISRINWF